jgi:GrpB-like predicted nucleotidyltransferase (UPF0157 family)
MKVIRPYDANWPSAFEREARTLRDAWEADLCALHHIGSTAIAGMIAKPVIDILAEVRSLEAIDAKDLAMQALGYQARGAYGIEGRRYFSKKRTDPDGLGFHVHAFARGSSEIGRHLRFRDYLIAVPDAAKEYAALKLSLCDPEGVLVSDYAERKAPFIELIDRKAKASSVTQAE